MKGRGEQGSRKLVSVVSRILDNHGLVRQSGYQTTSYLDYLVRHIRFVIRQYKNELSNQIKMCLTAW